MRHAKPALATLIPLVIGIAAPLVFSSAFLQHILVLFAIYAIAALSADLIIGYLGEITLGHAAFFGIGAYVSALLALKMAVPFWVALPAAGIMTALVSWPIGYAGLRVKGPYFAIVTLGFGAILGVIALKWIPVTNGALGLTRIPPPSPDFIAPARYYYLVLVGLLFTLLAIHRLTKCRWGRAIIALRENEALADSVGVAPLSYKMIAFSAAAFFAGIAGSYYAHYVRYVSPDLLGMPYLVTMLTSVIVGGRGKLLGPVVGAFIIIVAPEVLRLASDYREVIFALVLVLSVIFMPDGVVVAVRNPAVRIQAALSRRIAGNASGASGG